MKTLLQDQRGVAMTEAVIVLPFFILIWMCLAMLHDLYDGKLEAQVAAKNATLAKAMVSCCHENTEEAVLEGKASKAATIDNDTMSWLDKLGCDQPFSWSHAAETMRITVDGIPEPLGGPTVDVNGKQKFMCNMEPKDGLWELLVSLVNGLLEELMHDE